MLAWTASTDNVGVVGYEIYRALTDGGAANLVGTSPTATFTDPSLPAGTYWYFVKAYDAAGNVGSRTAYRSVTISSTPGDCIRPTTPTGLRAVW